MNTLKSCKLQFMLSAKPFCLMKAWFPETPSLLPPVFSTQQQYFPTQGRAVLTGGREAQLTISPGSGSLFWCSKISKEWVTKTFDFSGRIATYPTCQPRLGALWQALPVWFGNTAAAVFVQWHFQAARFGNTCLEHAWCFLVASSPILWLSNASETK